MSAPPALQAILSQTREALGLSPFEDGSLVGAGRAALDLLSRDPQTCLQLAYQQLHAVPYREVKTCWRRLYTDAALWQVLRLVDEERKLKEENDGEEDGGEEDWVGTVVKLLDMALILTGAVGREGLVEGWFDALDEVVMAAIPEATNELAVAGLAGTSAEDEAECERPTKRRKVCATPTIGLPETFPDTIPRSPKLQYSICRARNLSLSTFQAKVSKPATQTPLIIEGAIDYWPAFEDGRAWNKPSYLMHKTLHGRRLVPVEIGRSYTDVGWGQKILSFKEFMVEYMLENTNSTWNTNRNKKGYLAQHDLFAQIPSLRSDIAIPDYCYTSPAPQPTNPANVKSVEELDEPLLNAWFGPAGTISPLHTDPYHNILAQVVGYKYIRLYAPEETPKMYPRGTEGDGVDMSNTSQVDLDDAMEVWPEISCWENADGANRDSTSEDNDEKHGELKQMYPRFRNAKYMECVLRPGECLYIPTGWWHYVKSLTPSFSVSFWWN